ncbi:MAG: double-strand break repair helicase AddA [Rhodospirillales bacterium]|nr:double-strand break repair helicase AddA [Rhodospirillales bacterium]
MAAHAPGMTPAQHRASDPAASVWVGASAGTGKTKVLTDRVLRLLLGGTAPERILCLTFTRAAAAEMALRITRELARWTVADDETLTAALSGLTGARPSRATGDRARRLFAAVLDVPDGLKIQTIHAFCQSLLRRFPLEAGVAPNFEIADERMSTTLLGAARARLLHAARPEVDAALAAHLATMTAVVGEEDFGALLADVSGGRDRFAAVLTRHGGTAGAIAALRARLGVPEGATPGSVVAEASAEGAFNRPALTHAVRVLAGGTVTDQRRAQKIATWLAADHEGRTAGFDAYRRAYFRQDDGPLQSLITKKLGVAHPDAAEALGLEQERIGVRVERWNAARVAESSAALIEVAARHLGFYGTEKARHAVLDYGDQISMSRRLLALEGIAPWVLYKLDGGLDHLLIDEAQDTSPTQWAVITALAEEFFVGDGARATPRTLFAVGDEKQSIFSFQGADARALAAAHRSFRGQAEAAKRPWSSLPLAESFRSTAAVLTAVDAVFAQPAARDGVTAEAVPIRHQVHRAGAGGRVELWPPLAPGEAAPLEPWAPPVEREGADDPAARLAARIADRVAGWTQEPIAEGSDGWLEAHGRPIRPGDVLVLVRRRGPFVDHLLRAFKACGVPVAGIDRLVLTEQLAVMDLIALGEFCLLPDDNLTLATVLKSPLIGLDEEALFALAYNRGNTSLWATLARRRDECPAFAEAHEALVAFRGAADWMAPFEFYGEVLAARGGRAALLGRLGPESGDAIEEFLALALAYGRSHPPSLQGFLHWVQDGRAEIKRDFEQGRDEVRIMTVHGAKGLEAPVVFLPDTMRKPHARDPLVWLEEEQPDGGIGAVEGLLWPGRASREDPLTREARAQARAAQEEEYRRLLYVAMTRAEDRLYICGWQGRDTPPEDCWYALVRSGLESLKGVEPLLMPEGGAPEGTGLVYAEPQTAPLAPRAEPVPEADAPAPLPPELRVPPAEEPPAPRPLAPSRALPEPAPRSPIDVAGQSARLRGIAAHKLLEHLPVLAPAERPAAARRLLERYDLDRSEREALAEAMIALVADPTFSSLFAADALAEAPISAVVGKQVISGQIDRLLVGEREVIALDYKTGLAPTEDESVPEAYVAQMESYRAALAAIFPDRTITCGLLFVDAPRLIWL